MPQERCWKKDWVVDLDVKAFFDTVSWDLTMKAVTRHTDRKWVLLYVERWLKAPMQMPDGTVTRVTGYATRRSDFTVARQSVPALRLRSAGCLGSIRASGSSVSRTMR